MKYASLVDRVSGPRSKAWSIMDRAAALERQGRHVIHLSIGDTDFETPLAVKAAAETAMSSGRTHYSPLFGEQPLREAIARHESDRCGAKISPERVIVLPGAQCSLMAAFLCLTEHGDEVILLEPAYSTYDAVVQVGGASLKRFSLDRERSFALDVAALEATLGPDTQAILINSPNNPGGSIFDEETLKQLVSVCRERGIWIVSDEVYWSCTYDRPHCPLLSIDGAQEISVTVNSLSKSHAMTGWRLGWAIAPEELTTHMGNLAQCLLFGVSQFIQDAAVTALNETRSDTKEMMAELARRRDLVVERLADVADLRVIPPMGGMFVFIDVSATGLSGEEFAERLLDESGVAVIPGFAFGDSVAGFIRLGLTVDRDLLAEGTDRIRSFVASLRISA